jgi:MFS family permease
MVLGSIHAFSVFLEPLEAMFDTSRATISLIYSFSLVALTVAVLFGPAIYSRVKPATIYLLVALLGGLGTVLAAVADDLSYIVIGFSVIFGVANGLGYGFGLQFAARANPDQSGFAMGVVTAAYALGAVLAPYAFEVTLRSGGFSLAMATLGAVVFTTAIGAAWFVSQSGARYSYAETQASVSRLPVKPIVMIWLAYGSGVAAGLMAIGHAAGIAATAGFVGWKAAATIAGCNLVGSLLAGWLSDRISHRILLAILPALGATALLALSVLPGLTMVFLGVIGFTYGGIITAYPAAISTLFPFEDGSRAYGRVFTAWGIAGLLAPWFAGQIYDWNASYAPALWIAAALGLASALTASRIFRDWTDQQQTNGLT